MVSKIIANHNYYNQLILSPQFIKENKIDVSGKMSVHVGVRQKEVEVSVVNSLEEDVIQLSPDLVDFFMLPVNIPYEVCFMDGELHIGPVIGLLLKRRAKQLGKKFLRKCSDYTLNYESINGLIYVFSCDSIDMEKKTIEGYYYQPDVSPGKIPWKKAVFPYPDVIFKRTKMSPRIYKHLTSEIGDRIFNYPVFDKWEGAQWLEADASLAKYLPHTRLLYSSQDLDEMLRQHNDVFLKPTFSSHGHGIITASRKKDGDYFRFRDKHEEKIIRSEEEMDLQVKKIIAKSKYIVQQSIPTLTFKECPIAFRVIMQKDGSRQWQCTGIVGLLGHVGGIDSHVRSNNGTDFEKMLAKTGKLIPGEIEKLKKEIIDVCMIAGGVIDQYGRYGDLGIDVILDTEFHPWLIEINKRHDHGVPLLINDKNMYRTMRNRILEYAKALAEF